MRLDVFLTEHNFVKSRTQAKSLIEAGCVTINGLLIGKASYELTDENAKVSVDLSTQKYVSRGGLKLEYAFEKFMFDVTDKYTLDVGASTGGFTDCLLKHGAKNVIAVDSGTGQLNEKLLADDRVISFEKFNAKNMIPEQLPYIPDVAVMDVSFISAKLVIPSVFKCLKPSGDFICLIKPQFEVGKIGVGKNGVVKDKKLRDNAVKEVLSFAENCGFSVQGVIESPIKGGDGNIEFLAHFKKIAEDC